MALVQPVAWRSPKPSMLVRVQHAVLSLPTGCGRGLRSRLMAALVLVDPPSLREQSPESLRRLLLLDAWQSGLLHHLAKVATGNGPGVRLPQHPRAVAGGKKPFLPLDFLLAVWVRRRAAPMFLVSVAWGCLFFCFGGGMGRRGALRMRCLVTCGFDSHLKHLGWLI